MASCKENADLFTREKAPKWGFFVWIREWILIFAAKFPEN